MHSLLGILLGLAVTAAFDPVAASSALAKAAEGAKTCKAAGGPTGAGAVKVTFAPAGSVSDVVVESPFAGTAVGTCVEKHFRGATIPAFTGAPVTARRAFEIH